MIKTYIRSFQNLFVPEIKNTSENIFIYGNNNLLPNKLIEYVNNSGVAKRCVNKVASYIQADGFIDEKTKIFKVNAKQTADEILSQIAFDPAYFKGFVLNIGRDSNGKAVSAKHIPLQWVRKTLRGDYLVNPTLGTRDYKRDRNEYYAPYKGVQISQQELAAQIADKQYGNKGEILYCYIHSPDNPNYPVPDYYASIEDVLTSAEVQRYDLEAVMNGFVPSAILTLVGNTDNTTKDNNGKTQRDYLNESLEQFTGAIKDAYGQSGRNKLIVFEAPTKDEIPNLQAFDAKAILDSSNTKRDVVERSVCRSFGVHPVLVGYSDAAVLGNTQSIANASLELANNVNAMQRLIERSFKQVFPDLNWDISTFKPVNYIPEAAYSKLTDSEIRALFGYEPLVVEGGKDEKLLVEKLGVGGTQAFTQIIADPNLQPEQKRATLQMLFGLSETDALKLVPNVELVK